MKTNLFLLIGLLFCLTSCEREEALSKAEGIQLFVGTWECTSHRFLTEDSSYGQSTVEYLDSLLYNPYVLDFYADGSFSSSEEMLGSIGVEGTLNYKLGYANHGKIGLFSSVQNVYYPGSFNTSRFPLEYKIEGDQLYLLINYVYTEPEGDGTANARLSYSPVEEPYIYGNLIELVFAKK